MKMEMAMLSEKEEGEAPIIESGEEIVLGFDGWWMVKGKRTWWLNCAQIRRRLKNADVLFSFLSVPSLSNKPVRAELYYLESYQQTEKEENGGDGRDKIII